MLTAGLVPAAAVWAAGDLMPPSPKPEEYMLQWTPILYVVVFLAAVAVIGFKRAKRTRVN